MAKIEPKLKGSPKDTNRRVQVLAGLLEAFSSAGSNAVTDYLRRRFDDLDGSFASQLKDLKKQL